MESVTTAEETRIREDCAEDLVGACTEEAAGPAAPLWR